MPLKLMGNDSQNKEEKDDASAKSREVITSSQQVFYSAPLPPALEFERYERVLKGSADRIIKLAENQNTHRIFIEKIVVIFDSLKSLGGLIAGLVIVLSGIFGAIYLIMNGKSTEGYVTFFGGIIPVILAFLFGKSKNITNDK